MDKPIFYTGIGSRKTPDDVLRLMTEAGKALNKLGYHLRSGGAVGADLAFERKVTSNKEIYLPWPGFSPSGQHEYAADLWAQAQLIAQDPRVYPHWFYSAKTDKDKRKQSAVRKLQTRNVFQVLGADLQTPCRFVMCWTPDGAISHEQYRPGVTGGTGTAINLASLHKIPVFNLQRPDHRARIEKWLGLELSAAPRHSTMELGL